MSSGQYKNLNIMRTKRTLKVKSQAFLIIFNGLSFKQMKHFFSKVKFFLLDIPQGYLKMSSVLVLLRIFLLVALLANFSNFVFQMNSTKIVYLVVFRMTRMMRRVRIRSKKSLYSELFYSALFPEYLSVFSPNSRKFGKNADQNNSEYGLFLNISHN